MFDTRAAHFGAVSDAVTALVRLFTKRKWPAIPEPDENIQSLHRTVSALKARSLVQSRETANVRDSFVTVQDLVDLGVLDETGKRLATRVDQLEKDVHP